MPSALGNRQSLGATRYCLRYRRKMEEWHHRLRRMRRATRLSQVRVGKELGIAGPSVAQWEIGRSRPSLDRLPALAKLYQVTLDELCGNDLGSPQEATRAAELAQQNTPARRLLAAREAYWETFDEAVSALDVDPGWLRKIEAGDLPLTDTFVLKFCAVTKCPPAWIERGQMEGTGMVPEMSARIGYFHPYLLRSVLREATIEPVKLRVVA